MPVKFETTSKSSYLAKLRFLQSEGKKILFAYMSDWNSEFYFFYED